MARTNRPARVIAAVALALLAAYVAVWAQVSPLNVGRSDFTSTYVGGTLLREGDAGALYNPSIQHALHSRLIAPDTEGNLPFVDAPIAAALAAPVTLLDLQAAYRLWSVLQVILLVIAVVIAVRAAPWAAGTSRTGKLAAAAAALAGAGSLVALLQAQWGSVLALGLALAYRDWRGGRPARGAALLVVAACVAKPHLAIGLVAFMLGWRNRRVIAGAAAGALAAAAASVAIAGPSGIAQFFSLAITSNTNWQLRTFSGFVGIAGSFLGNSAGAQVVGVFGSVAALAAAAYLGVLARRRPGRFDLALAGAAALSILAAPHAGMHDLAMLAPVLVWSVAAAGGGVRLVAGLWAALSLAAFISLADGAATPPGQLVPWVLIAAAMAAWWAASRGPAAARHPVPSDGDEAALGSLAHDLPQQRRAAAAGMLPLQRRGG